MAKIIFEFVLLVGGLGLMFFLHNTNYGAVVVFLAFLAYLTRTILES